MLGDSVMKIQRVTQSVNMHGHAKAIMDQRVINRPHARNSGRIPKCTDLKA